MVRTKRSAAHKDALPDEIFSRIRGALFFGPEFKVTRNKLLFRDNLQELLAAAVPSECLSIVPAVRIQIGHHPLVT